METNTKTPAETQIAEDPTMSTSTRTLPTVTSTPNGWHQMPLLTTSPATGVKGAWLITWRTDRFSCCGSQPQIVWDSGHPPVRGSDTWGDPQFAVQQCGGCGTNHTHHYTAKEIAE